MFTKDKKAVSAMVGYILLIVISIVIAGFVYSWLKTYTPQEDLECNDGVSLAVKDYELSNNSLNLFIENNGNFNIRGILIYYANSSNQGIAVHDLTEFYNYSNKELIKNFGGIGFAEELEPGKNVTLNFNVKGINVELIEIIPMEERSIKNKLETLKCTGSKTEIEF